MEFSMTLAKLSGVGWPPKELAYAFYGRTMTSCTPKPNLDCSSLYSLVGILLFSSYILSVLLISGLSKRVASDEPQAIINIIRERLSET
jgi:hypothetical protein